MTRAHTTTHTTEHKLFYAGASLVALVVFLYVYFVSVAVAHVVVRKEVSQEVVATETRISELESDYIATKNHVTEDMALTRGFHINEEKVFVRKMSPHLVLSQNDTR